MIINLTDIKSFAAIYKICTEPFDASKDNDLYINCDLPYMNTGSVLMFAQTVIFLRHLGYKVAIDCKSNRVKNFIKEIGLEEFCNNRVEVITPNDIMKCGLAMPILKVDSSTLVQYISLVKIFISRFCKHKDLTFLESGISELVNNVHDHAKSPIGGYVFGVFHPKERTIKIAVSDMGIGIAQNVRAYLKDSNLPDSECVKWALQEFNTTKSTTYNAGRGLANLLDFVCANESKISIYTGDVAYTRESGDNGCNEVYSNSIIKPFVGTVVRFDIRIDNLPEEDTEYIENPGMF